MAIRWGKGDWLDLEIEPLFPCPAFPTAGPALAGRIAERGLETVLPEIALLHDRDDSGAWRDWHEAAGIPYRKARDDLVVPDPNVRVQSVIDGQGVALNDALVAAELADGRLHRLSSVELTDYGYYLVYPKGALGTPGLRAFYDWLKRQVAEGTLD